MGDEVNRINGQQPSQEASILDSNKQVVNKSYDKINNILQRDVDNSLDTIRAAQQTNRSQDDVNAIKDIASQAIKAETVVKDQAANKTILTQAIQETSSMAKLSEEALKLSSGKIAGDVAQVNQKTVTDNTKNTKVAEYLAGTEQAIRQDDSIRRKERIPADQAIKGGSSQRKNTDTLESDMRPNKVFKKNEEEVKAEVETSTEDNGQESKGKALAEERRKENIEKQKEEKLKETLGGDKEHNKKTTIKKSPTQPEPHGANKLRAKFRKSALHF